MQFLNQHSFTLTGAAALLALGYFLLKDGATGSDWLALGALALGLGIAWWFLSPGPSTLTQGEQIAARIGSGEPVLLEFQSPY